MALETKFKLNQCHDSGEYLHLINMFEATQIKTTFYVYSSKFHHTL